MFMRLGLLILLLGACAPTIAIPNAFNNEDPDTFIEVAIVPGQWLMTDRISAAYFDVPLKDLNRFPHRKRNFKLMSVNAPLDWNVTLNDINLHRQVLEKSGSSSTFVDYLDVTFKVDVPSRFEGLVVIEAEIAYGDGPIREVLLVLASHEKYLELDDSLIS